VPDLLSGIFNYHRIIVMQKPSPIIYPGPFNQYIDEVAETDLQDAFNKQLPIINSFLSSISEERSKHAYAVGKWTIKELLQHLIDTERILSYRALCSARGEKQMLPGFDENEYAANTNANDRTWHSLGNEFLIVRQSTHLLFNSFTNDMLMADAHFSNRTNTTAGIGFIILGHFYHHKKIVEERYL
jgi:DinB superfamily